MNQNQIDLHLKYTSNRFKSPQLLLTSNGISTVYTSSDTHVKFLLPLGVHRIDLLMFNKEVTDTVVEDGKIVDDMYVVIEDLKINNISFMDKIDTISAYTDCEGNQISTHGWLSFPTPYVITLQTPGYFFNRNLALLGNNWQKNYNS